MEVCSQTNTVHSLYKQLLTVQEVSQQVHSPRMDSIMAVSGMPTAYSSSIHSSNFHSTTDSFVSSLSTLAHHSLQDHINDYADAHRWIDSFFQKLEIKGPSSGANGSRSVLTHSRQSHLLGHEADTSTNGTTDLPCPN